MLRLKWLMTICQALIARKVKIPKSFVQKLLRHFRKIEHRFDADKNRDFQQSLLARNLLLFTFTYLLVNEGYSNRLVNVSENLSLLSLSANPNHIPVGILKENLKEIEDLILNKLIAFMPKPMSLHLLVDFDTIPHLHQSQIPNESYGVVNSRNLGSRYQLARQRINRTCRRRVRHNVTVGNKAILRRIAKIPHQVSERHIQRNVTIDNKVTLRIFSKLPYQVTDNLSVNEFFNGYYSFI